MSRCAAIRTLLLCSAVVAAVACTGNPAGPDEIPLGRPFELRVGAAAVLDDGLQIRFESVRSDSRCPMDALCVWAGDAVVAITLWRSSGDRAERELHTQISGSEITYSVFSIKLTGLSPYPRSSLVIQPGDYVASLIIQRR